MTIRTATELFEIDSFKERYNYLKLDGFVGRDTFGYDRYLNQRFYQSAEWQQIRYHVIARDLGCDLGVEGFDIYGMILIHHMNAITKRDIIERNSLIFDIRYLISTTQNTHRAIHYGDKTLLTQIPIERSQNDTCPWRR